MIWKESGETENRLIRKNYKRIQNENVLRHILFLNVKSRACALLFWYNYDLEVIRQEYDRISNTIMEMQIALDRYNQTVLFDVDI